METTAVPANQEEDHQTELLTRDKVVEVCKERGILLGTSDWRSGETVRLWAKPQSGGHFELSKASPGVVPSTIYCPADGLSLILSGMHVGADVKAVLDSELLVDGSDVRRLSIWPVTRSFVYLDVSDFSKFATGEQLIVVNYLQRFTEQIIRREWWEESPESRMCIGDGYIYVFRTPEAALHFACFMAMFIETLPVMEPLVLEFHFRIGLHYGEVNCFWDAGQGDWNYMGDGILGGKRVLDAGGKSVDDVVYLSVQTERAIRRWPPATHAVLPHLTNIGRRTDKHGKMWRIYQANHNAIASQMNDAPQREDSRP